MPRTDHSIDSGEQEQKLKVLREALIAGENSGPPQPFDMAQFIDEQRAIAEGEAKPITSVWSEAVTAPLTTSPTANRVNGCEALDAKTL